MRYCVEKQSLACMAWVTHCYMQLEESLDKCKSTTDQLILKNRIFDMLDRVKFLLDKKYEPDLKENTDNSKFIKGDIIMRTHLTDVVRDSETTIKEANEALASGRFKKPHKVAFIKETRANAIRERGDAMKQLEELDRMDARPYSDTRIGYNADMRRQYAHDAMDLVNKILPHIADDYDDMDDDDYDEVVDRRGRRRGWRPRRTRRGVGRFTQVRTHVRRMPRSDMDDMDYDDDRYDDDMRYDDVRRTAEHARRTADDVKRMADDMRRMVDDRRTMDDRRDIYPGTQPVMPHNDRRTSDDARYDRYEDRNDRMRNDDARNDTNDDAHRPGPAMR